MGDGYEHDAQRGDCVSEDVRREIARRNAADLLFVTRHDLPPEARDQIALAQAEEYSKPLNLI